MRNLRPLDGQQCLEFEDEVIIVDKFEPLREKDDYFADRAFTLFCTEGKIQLEMNGRQVVVGQQQMLCCTPNSVISEYMTTPDFACHIVGMAPKALTPLQIVDRQLFNHAVIIKRDPVVTLDDGQWERLATYYRLLRERMERDQEPFYAEIVRTLVSAFTMEVLALFRHKADISLMRDMVGASHGDVMAHRFLRLVEDCGGRERRVEAYAEQLNISAKYLSTIVRQSLGQKPSQIIATATMQVIEQRLRYTDMTMKEIAHELDFPNTSFFGKYVREHLGLPPMEYRRKYRKQD